MRAGFERELRDKEKMIEELDHRAAGLEEDVLSDKQVIAQLEAEKHQLGLQLQTQIVRNMQTPEERDKIVRDSEVGEGRAVFWTSFLDKLSHDRYSHHVVQRSPSMMLLCPCWHDEDDRSFVVVKLVLCSIFSWQEFAYMFAA